MVFNQANIGYIPAIVIKEVSVGRQAEIVGAVYLNIKTREEYDKHKKELIGLFGEVIGWKGNTIQIATRALSDCPMWVREMVDRHAWDCKEMFRWQVPEDQR